MLKWGQINTDPPKKEGNLEPDDHKQAHDHNTEQDFSHCEHSLNAEPMSLNRTSQSRCRWRV